MKSYIEILWEYLTVRMPLRASDVILVFGSHDEHTAVKAAQLYLDGFSDTILFSGGSGKITEEIWHEPEALRFSGIAERMGVPASAILTETESRNTFENIELSKVLLKGRNIRSVLAVDKPYKVKRTFLMLSEMWGNVDICMASEDISCEEYLRRYEKRPYGVSCDDVISLMTGEISRIMKRERIPSDVFSSFELLCDAGFDRYCF